MTILTEITLEQFIKVCPKNSVKLQNNKLPFIEKLLVKRFCTQEKIAKEVGCSRRYIGLIFDGKRNPNIKLATQVCTLTSIHFNELIERIYPKGHPDGSYIFPSSFPINLNENIAAIIGHSFGDGHLNKVFAYSNTSNELIESARIDVKKLPIYNITSNCFEHNGTNIRFSTLVRDILICASGPKGSKVLQKTFVPDWILHGADSIKASFLQSIFDDEACIAIDKNEISLGFSKDSNFTTNLEEFLSNMKIMLESLGIDGITITKGKSYIRKGKQMSTRVLHIYGKTNFIEFEKRIGFSHSEKNTKLLKMINKIKIIKMNSRQRDKQLLNLLENKPNITANLIATETGMTPKGVLNKMKIMARHGLVTRNGKYNSLWNANLQKAQGMD